MPRVSTQPLITSKMTRQRHQFKCLKTTTRVHHIYNRDTEHIRPLWVAQSQESQVSQTDCEVDTGAGCNILPANRAQQLFGQE